MPVSDSNMSFSVMIAGFLLMIMNLVVDICFNKLKHRQHILYRIFTKVEGFENPSLKFDRFEPMSTELLRFLI